MRGEMSFIRLDDSLVMIGQLMQAIGARIVADLEPA